MHNIRRCEIVDCCTSKQKLYHCLFCPTPNFKPARLAKVKTHIIVHWRARVEDGKGKPDLCSLRVSGTSSVYCFCSTAYEIRE